MTIRELIEALENAAEDCIDGKDAEVRLAFQPSWPLQYKIQDNGIVVVPGGEGDEEGDMDLPADVVYIGEGGQLYNDPYLPGAVARELGWK